MSVRAELPAPEKGSIMPMHPIKEGCLEHMTEAMTFLPHWGDSELGFSEQDIEFANMKNPRALYEFQGGEDQALSILKEYLGESK